LGRGWGCAVECAPFFENIRALIASTVADQDTIFLPWAVVTL
jgi:hypothetical protein